MYLNDPIFNIVDSVGAPISGAKAYFYLTGTTTLVNTYTTVGRTVANTNPVIADSAGRFPPIYLDPDITYRMQLKDASDILIADRDPIAGEGGEVFQYVHRTIATAGQTAFTLPITYTVGASALTVYVNGLRVEQGAGLDYVETNNTTITFTSGLAAGDLVVVAIYRNVDAAATPPNYTVESIAALRLLTTATAATQLFLLYNYVAGDGGGAFRYDSTDTTTADNSGTVIVDAAGRRWKRQWSGPVDLRWFGARCNGTTADDAAWAALFVAYPNGFVTVTWPGYTRITQTIQPPAGCSNVALQPQQGGSIMATGTQAFTLLTLPNTVSGWVLEDVSFFTGSAASGSEYFAIDAAASYVTLENIDIRTCHSGVRVTGAKFYARKLYVSGGKVSAGRGLVIDQATTGTEVVEVRDLFIEADPAARPLYGVHIIQGAAVYLEGFATQQYHGLYVAPTNGKIVATLDFDFEVDNCSNIGAVFTQSGTGAIQRLHGFLRATSNDSDGIDFQAVPQSTDLQIRAVDNFTRGVRLRGYDFANSRFYVMAGGNGTHGVELDNSVTKVTLYAVTGSIDDFGTNGQYGVVIGSSCDNFTVYVDGAGGAVGQLYNGSGTSATKVVNARA